ncbi:restriction endonuclease subunit S [uncultured Clostridium sp.]|uniref:restriction endonuclease subunit S n=1 Tax=uncultured Clostridium sp. TaxID=59620 RepID=UPI0027296654|nr:restriction endonuclease subunit S [uncultured Clostridium sp.]
MNLRYVICSEIIDVRDGTHDSPKYIIDGGYPLITSKNINNNKIDFSNVNYISEEDYIKINQRSEVSNGDIIMPMIGTIGNPVIIDTDKKFAIKNVALFKLANNETILSKYFYYILKTQDIKRQLESNKRGGTQNFVSLKNIRDLKIPLIDILEQKKIVEILDKAQQLIDKRKKQIESLDELVKSQFIEMFGDPVSNPKGWEKGKIADIIIKTQYGTSNKANEENGQFKILRMGNITYNGHFDFSDMKYIDLTEDEQKKYLVYKGEVLFNRTNSKELVGKTAVYKENEPMAYAGYLVKALPNERATGEFIAAYMNTKYVKSKLLNMAKNIVGMANINAEEFKKIDIYIPPIELQNEYIKFIEQVDKLKFEMENSLKELEDNFNSLMQKAFKGELFI